MVTPDIVTIDFPSHFILSIIDVHRDTTTHDKLIFPSAIMRILRHFSIPFPIFDHFHVVCAIDAATVKWSEAQLLSRQSGLATPPTPSAPSIFAPSFSVGGVTLDAIMAQFQCIDARLDTLNDELCQVNTRVSHIAKWQARLGGYVKSPSPPLEASEDGDDSDDDDDGDDEDASSFDADGMST